MSSNSDILNGLIDALGMSGNLFILWDQQGKIVCCDSIIEEKLNALHQEPYDKLDITLFINLLIKNKYIEEEEKTLFLNTFQTSTQFNNRTSIYCKIPLLTEQNTSEINFIPTSGEYLLTLFKFYRDESKELATIKQAISKAPIGIMLWDDNDKLLIASEKSIESDPSKKRNGKKDKKLAFPCKIGPITKWKTIRCSIG